MHRFASLFCAWALLLAVGCASGPSYSKPTFVGGNGLSFDSPVIILGAKSLPQGFAAEKQWLDSHFPGATQTGHEYVPLGDRRFDIFDFTTADGRTVHVYFDVTDFVTKVPG
jgi:hypothetical protein